MCTRVIMETLFPVLPEPESPRGCVLCNGKPSKKDSREQWLMMSSCSLRDQLGWAHSCQERYRDEGCGRLAHGANSLVNLRVTFVRHLPRVSWGQE